MCRPLLLDAVSLPYFDADDINVISLLDCSDEIFDSLFNEAQRDIRNVAYFQKIADDNNAQLGKVNRGLSDSLQLSDDWIAFKFSSDEDKVAFILRWS